MKLVIIASALALLLVSCKRPGTDRELQCDRYGDLYLEKRVECGGKTVDGKTLTADNADEIAKVFRLACMADKKLTPTADCLKELASATCAAGLPDRSAMPACAQ